jgi:hypothetical protein
VVRAVVLEHQVAQVLQEHQVQVAQAELAVAQVHQEHLVK